ncbi:hypothetical protein NC653_022236 [Populus alba x Populus x berolinensis]|uniref:Uncharacterized protein n=1 Tax=Populus alba x Populus x berolinensis TaxID=444605 RepID=A0AAD6MEP0_9ROSI|nr:hypothetical protein NC653_022236 [Populus alba x Populus x berolinensis]
MSSQGFPTSDFSVRSSSIGINGPLIASNLDTNTPKFKRELESVQSPFGLSESEESGAGENKPKDKGTDSSELSLSATQKVGTSVLPTKKNKSSTNEIGDGITEDKKEWTSESGDDHEELFSAANSAWKASDLACSGPFWKKMDSIFASVSLEDLSYLKQQNSKRRTLIKNQSRQLYVERADMGSLDKGALLYQRVLSALIEEDESEEFYLQSESKNMSLNYASDRLSLWFHSVISNAIRNPSMSSSLHSNEQWLVDDDFSQSDAGHASEICSNDPGVLQMRKSNMPGFSSSDGHYQLMCLDERLLLELQSIGFIAQKHR